MIDFRYHLVSIISVFLALAVGIVLGAGPLRDYIADELSGQVDQLRTEKDALRAELDETNTELASAEQFITASAAPLLTDALPRRTVAIVSMPGADNETTQAVIDRLEQAGAEVTAQIAVTDKFTTASQLSFRQGLAGNITPADADEESIPANATSILEMLESGELISQTEPAPAPVNATVMVAPADPAEGEENTAMADVAGGLVTTGEASVLLGTDTDGGDLVHVVRADADTNAEITTVDSIDIEAGQIIAPRALAAAIDGTTGSYGFVEGLTAVIPPDVDLGPPGPPEVDVPDESDDGGQG